MRRIRDVYASNILACSSVCFSIDEHIYLNKNGKTI